MREGRYVIGESRQNVRIPLLWAGLKSRHRGTLRKIRTRLPSDFYTVAGKKEKDGSSQQLDLIISKLGAAVQKEESGVRGGYCFRTGESSLLRKKKNVELRYLARDLKCRNSRSG